jgi:3,4-dihydroxy 2-butanone 4-phosphate synthase / GTP cyclohydrolase II
MGKRNGERTQATIAAWSSGSFVLCCTGEGPRMRGDIMLAAQFATDHAVNTMLAVGRGLLCLALAGPLFDRLELTSTDHDDAWSNPRAPVATATIEAASDITTGISARDRARTIAAAIACDAGPATIRQPGHVPVVRAASGGLAQRVTPVEAAIALCERSGTVPAAVLSEVLDESGDLGGLPYLANLATLLRLPLLHVEDLAASTAAAGRG